MLGLPTHPVNLNSKKKFNNIEMKTIKVIKISIKNPRLRSIRRNLRTVIKLAVDAKKKRLAKLEYLYQEKRISQGLTSSQRKREVYLSQARVKLGHALRESTCSGGDCDVVWIPWSEKWVSEGYYEHMYRDMTFDEFIEFLAYDDMSNTNWGRIFGYSFKHRP